jgi:hypothetical protein
VVPRSRCNRKAPPKAPTATSATAAVAIKAIFFVDLLAAGFVVSNDWNRGVLDGRT